MKKLQPTEYMYASARIRAMENRLVGKERIDVLTDLKSSEDVMNKLSEYGVAPAEQEEQLWLHSAMVNDLSAALAAHITSLLYSLFEENQGLWQIFRIF